MNNWQYLLYGAVGLLLLTAFFCRALGRRKQRRLRDFERVLGTLLQPREKVKAICPQKGFTCILTGSRIIFEKKGSFTAFPLKSIRKLKGLNEKGNRTTVPSRMKQLILELENVHILYNTGPDFEVFAELLQKALNKSGKKKSSGKKAADPAKSGK